MAIPLIDAHCERMQTARAKQLCPRRGSVIERTCAEAKAHRNLRRLSGHAKGEVGLIVFAQSMITIQRLRKAAASSSKTAAWKLDGLSRGRESWPSANIENAFRMSEQ